MGVNGRKLLNVRSPGQAFWHDDEEREKSLLLLQVARRYYDQGMGQAEIAKALGYSRATISRLLSEARRTGVVTISITHPLERLAQLEQLIANRYGARNVRVIPDAGPGTGMQSVGFALARFLARVAEPGMSIGMTTGRVHQVAAEHLGRQPSVNIKVLQMVGRSGGGHGRVLDTANLCKEVAEAFGGVALTFDAPLLAASPRQAADLRASPRVERVLRQAGKVDLAVIGIGASFRHPADVFSDKLTSDVVRNLHRHGAIGHVVGRFIDSRGRAVSSALDDLVVGISLAELRRVPLVLGVAAGSQKARAIAAALRGGLVNSLLLDVDAAQALAYLPEKEPASSEPLWAIED